MNDLHKAYLTLELEPGATLRIIQARYRRLAKELDIKKGQSAEEGVRNREKLRDTDKARETLEAHFGNGDHRLRGACLCRADRNQANANRKRTEVVQNLVAVKQMEEKTEEAAKAAEKAKRKEEKVKQQAEEQKRRAKEATEQVKKKNAWQWKVIYGGTLAIVLFCLIPLAVRSAFSPIISLEDFAFGDHPSKEEEVRRNRQLVDYIEDKHRVLTQILRHSFIPYEQAAGWHPPFASNSDMAEATARQVYYSLARSDVQKEVDKCKEEVNRNQAEIARQQANVMGFFLPYYDQQREEANTNTQHINLEQSQEKLRVAQEKLNDLGGDLHNALTEEQSSHPIGMGERVHYGQLPPTVCKDLRRAQARMFGELGANSRGLFGN